MTGREPYAKLVVTPTVKENKVFVDKVSGRSRRQLALDGLARAEECLDGRAVASWRKFLRDTEREPGTWADHHLGCRCKGC